MVIEWFALSTPDCLRAIHPDRTTYILIVHHILIFVKRKRNINIGNVPTKFLYNVWEDTVLSGADPGFQVREGALKKIAPSGGRREKFWGISCEKTRFYAKKSYSFQLRREVRKIWDISCEKSRFYAKKIIFFPILGGARAGCAPLGSAPAGFTKSNWARTF